jgi:hypothetical protein
VSLTDGPPETVLAGCEPVTPVTAPVQDKATEWVPAATPVPDNEMFAGELEALLLTVTLPVAAPLAEGANVEVSVVLCPDERVSLLEDVELNPAPATSTCEIVTSELPAFVRIMCWVLLLAVFTLPKFKLLVLDLSIRAPVSDTVNEAALLVITRGGYGSCA